MVDWPCEVQTLFRNTNLGCKDAVSSAITWFFSHVEEGIILEDDCLPDPSFFRYCVELLERYRNDARVMMVSGYNPVRNMQTQESYLFSMYGAIWGWASWRRAWQAYSLDRAMWENQANQKEVRQLIGSAWQWKIKRWSYERAFSGQKNTWDYQWEFARILKHGLSTIPSVNMIENIGFGADSTHTAGKDSLRLPAQPIAFPLEHPHLIEQNRTYDNNFIETVFGRERFPAKVARMLGFKRR